jgi:hypothetical protein
MRHFSDRKYAAMLQQLVRVILNPLSSNTTAMLLCQGSYLNTTFSDTDGFYRGCDTEMLTSYLGAKRAASSSAISQRENQHGLRLIATIM